MQNRDRTGALNIGVQFGRLFRGQGPLRSMTKEEKEIIGASTANKHGGAFGTLGESKSSPSLRAWGEMWP